MKKDTKDFKVRDFRCNHCYSNGIQQELIDLLQEIKDETKLSIYITGAYRCKAHHKNIVGEKLANDKNTTFQKYYTKGLGVDFRMVDKEGKLLDGSQISELIEKTGLLDDCGLKINKTFVTMYLCGEYERINDL